MKHIKKNRINRKKNTNQKEIKVKKIWKHVCDLVYPSRCPICHKIVEAGYEMVCASCIELLPVITNPHCQKCGKPIDISENQDAVCHDCAKTEHKFEKGTAVFLYDDVMRNSISYFKYKGRQEYGVFYGKAAWKFRRDLLQSWNVEAVIPVPVHKSRRIARGYNQAEIIAKALSKEMEIPMFPDAVVRIGKTIAQKELTPEERRQNLEHAFFVKNPFPWKRVLLVDDIYTTGSTADAICTAIKKRGNCEIYVLSICIGKGFMV